MSDITPLEEKKLRSIIRKGYLLMVENEKRQLKEEKRLRKVIQKLLQEADGEQVITSTGISILGRVLDSIYKVSKDGYKFLKTSPEQRKAFLKTWEWLFKESFFGDVKIRNAVEKAAKQIQSKGFDTEEAEEVPEELNELFLSEQKDEDDDKVIMKITDPDLVQEPVEQEKSEEELETEEEDDFVKDITSAPEGSDRTGPSEAVRIFNQTKKEVFNAFDDLKGDDAEKFYKWFFINMLGSENSGFSDEAGENVVGHYERAELELKELGIETSQDLLPSEDPESYNLQDTDF
tara:strand:+ start:222 stop:1094 length:873 start_codon:yes stop_codon:yes gene_type:complete